MNENNCTVTYGYDFLKNCTFYGIMWQKNYNVFWSLEKLNLFIVKNKLKVSRYIEKFPKNDFSILEV